MRQTLILCLSWKSQFSPEIPHAWQFTRQYQGMTTTQHPVHAGARAAARRCGGDSVLVRGGGSTPAAGWPASPPLNPYSVAATGDMSVETCTRCRKSRAQRALGSRPGPDSETHPDIVAVGSRRGTRAELP